MTNAELKAFIRTKFDTTGRRLTTGVKTISAIDAVIDAAFDSAQYVKTVKLEIPSAEVLALFTTPKQFGIVVPSGYYISAISCDLKSTYGGVAYATNTNLGIRAVGASSTVFIKKINYTEDVFSKSTDSATGVQYIEGVDFEAFVQTGNPTAGNSDITIYLTYALVEL